MPTREGFYSSGAQAGAHGGFDALGDVFARMRQSRTADKASQRTLTREEALKRYTEAKQLVASGEKTPEEAAAYAGQGAKPEHFAPFVPSQDSTVAKLASVLKPGVTDEEASIQMHGMAPLRNVPNIQRPSPFSEPGSLEYESPIQKKISDLLSARETSAYEGEKPTKIGETADVTPGFGQQSTETETGNRPEASLGGDVTPQSIYGKFDPRTQSIREIGRVASGPSAATKGQAEGIADVAAAPGKGQAQSQIEDILRPGKVKTSQAVQQSTIDTETAPGNVRKEVGRQSALTYGTTRARDEAIQAGIDPAVVKSYIHGTATGKAYLYFPPATDKDVIKKTMNQIATNPAMQGSRVVNAQQSAALENVQSARADYDRMVQLVMKHVAKDYAGNIAQAPRNYLANLTRSDPEIRALVQASFPEQVKGLRAIAGAFGRITQQEINKAIGAFPSVTEPLDTLIVKRGLYFDALESTENAILDNK